MNFNRQAELSAMSYADFDFDSRNVHLMLGCSKAQVASTLEKSVKQD